MSAKKQDIFTRFTTTAARAMGHAGVFVGAVTILVLWGASGPFLGFSDTWQLIINTGTTIITFLMVFIIQNTQNRDNLAMNIKLDRIMETIGIQEKDVIEAEDKSDEVLERKQKKVQNQRQKKSTRQRS